MKATTSWILYASPWVALATNGCGSDEPREHAVETANQGGSGGHSSSDHPEPGSSTGCGSAGCASEGDVAAIGTSGSTSGSGGAAGAFGEKAVDTEVVEPNLGRAGAAGASADDSAGLVTFDVSHKLASDVDPDAPGTIGIVEWSVNLERIDEAHIEFGLDTNYGMLAPADDVGDAQHRTLLLGMKPARSYHFRVVAENAAGSSASQDYVIQTGPPTDLIGIAHFNVLDDAARERGFIVMSYFREVGVEIPFILDSDGEVVWWYERGRPTIRARMSATGKNMWMIEPTAEGAPLERITMDTLESELYENTLGSHDITPVEGELMAYIDYGEDDCDSIFEIDPSGTVREIFESTDHIEGNCHGNALRYSQREDVYTFSDVDRDIFVVNRQGEVEWRLSEIVPRGNSAWSRRSHGHQLLDNSLLMFANHGGPDTSAVFEFSLTGEEIMYYDSGLLTDIVGDVQRLPGGNTLVTLATPSVVQEVDGDGNVVLEIEGSGATIGYTLWLDSLYGPPPDIAQ